MQSRSETLLSPVYFPPGAAPAPQSVCPASQPPALNLSLGTHLLASFLAQAPSCEFCLQMCLGSDIPLHPH